MMAHTSYPEMASLLLFGMNNGSRSLFPTGKFFIDHQAGQVQIARLYKNNSCSCWYFSKWGICKHAVAFSNVYDLSWFGDKYRIERSKFHALLKKGRHPLATNAWVSD